MATSELNQEWQAYKEAANRFYEVAEIPLAQDSQLSDNEVERADQRLSAVAMHAERVTNSGILLFEHASGKSREEIATCLLAAAATDIAIACEALRLRQDPPTLGFALLRAIEDVETESAQVLIGEADPLFGLPVGANGPDTVPPDAIGAAIDPDRTELLEYRDEAFDELVKSACAPAWRFATGMVSVGPEKLAMYTRVDPLGLLGQLRYVAGRIKRPIIKLLREGFRKLLGASQAKSTDLVREGADFLKSQVVETVRATVQSAFASLLGSAAGRSDAERETEALINNSRVLTDQVTAGVRSDLRDLSKAYADQMKRMDTIAKLISHASPFISTLAAPVGGPLLVAALDGIGVGFVVGSLRVKVTGRLLAQDVDGVVTIVRRRIQPNPA